MRHPLLLTILCLLVCLQALAQDTIITMTTTKDSVSLYVVWTGAGSITANGVKLDNDYFIENIITTADGSVVLTAMGEVLFIDLWCHNNSLSTLDITNCPMLSILNCTQNSLKDLDVTKCTKLKSLACYLNSLTDLNVRKCPELTGLECDRNYLTALDITKCLELKSLSCSNNSLTDLDVTKCLELTVLYCGNNFLRTLDVSKGTMLKDLSCPYNSLSALDVTNCTELITLACENNSLSVLDITKCTRLGTLYASGQTLMLPTVERIDDDKLSIKNLITFVDDNIGIDNISHGGTYADGHITWIVSGESGEVTFDFTTKLPKYLAGRPYSGTVTQSWTKK